MIFRNELNRPAKGVHTGGRDGGPARKEVMIKTFGHGKYKRTLADVLLPDGTIVNHTLVKYGCAGGIGSMRRSIQNWTA